MKTAFIASLVLLTFAPQAASQARPRTTLDMGAGISAGWGGEYRANGGPSWRVAVALQSGDSTGVATAIGVESAWLRQLFFPGDNCVLGSRGQCVATYPSFTLVALTLSRRSTRRSGGPEIAIGVASVRGFDHGAYESSTGGLIAHLAWLSNGRGLLALQWTVQGLLVPAYDGTPHWMLTVLMGPRLRTPGSQ